MSLVIPVVTATGVWCLGIALSPVMRRQPPPTTARHVGTPHRVSERTTSPPPPTRPGLLAARRHHRARARVALDLPDALELVVLAVRAGHLPTAALRTTLPHVAPSVRPALADVVARVDRGERFGDAVGALVDHLGDDALVLVDTFAAADRYGLPLAPVLERLADDARRRRRRHAETLARQLPVRLSLPLVLCTLPSFVLLAVVPLLLAALSSLEW
jgi:Flp pilus assembly protein TadB